jgi:hypothetical protein
MWDRTTAKSSTGCGVIWGKEKCLRRCTASWRNHRKVLGLQVCTSIRIKRSPNLFYSHSRLLFPAGAFPTSHPETSDSPAARTDLPPAHRIV